MTGAFTDHMPTLVDWSYFTAPGEIDTVKNMSMEDLYRFVQTMFEGKKALQGDKVCSLRNLVIRKA